MNQRNRYLKVRLNRAEYAAVMKRSSEAGLNISEFIRTIIDVNESRISVEEVVERLQQQISVGQPGVDSRSDQYPLLVEAVLLIRELVAERNIQLLSRTSQRLDQLFPGRSKL